VRKKRAPKLCTACTKPIARDGRLAMVSRRLTTHTHATAHTLQHARTDR
jgi:hypothetical protein